jgi:capsule polysaccharide modification protein KpsS
MITDANIHSIIKASDVTVSINSTVALEGFMHKTPAILFGDADFHHFCGRVEAAEQFKDVLPQVLLLFNNPHGAFGG